MDTFAYLIVIGLLGYIIIQQKKISDSIEGEGTEQQRQELADKLDALIEDVKGTIK